MDRNDTGPGKRASVTLASILTLRVLLDNRRSVK